MQGAECRVQGGGWGVGLRVRRSPPPLFAAIVLAESGYAAGFQIRLAASSRMCSTQDQKRVYFKYLILRIVHVTCGVGHVSAGYPADACPTAFLRLNEAGYECMKRQVL